MKTNIVNHLIIVQLQGILTPAEKRLAETTEGMLSIKKIRADLVESGGDELKELVGELVGQPIITFHTDISTKTGERVMVFVAGTAVEFA